MPTKKQNKLRVAKTGRVELVLEDEGSKDKSAKAVGSVKAAGSNKAAGSAKAGGSGKAGGKAKSSGKAKTAKEAEAAIEHSESDEGDDLDLTESEIEIDFAMGTKVFGYRDLRTGKFVARSNYSFQIDAFCDGKRFNYPSWQVTVSDRKNLTQVLLPDNLDRLKDINNYISGVLKRPVYADLPDKQFIAYFRKQLKEHIHTRDITKVIVSYTGYQEESIDINDTNSFLCILGSVVLNKDGLPVKDHEFVFSPEVVQRKVDAKSNIAKLVSVPIELLSPSSARDQFAKVLAALPCGSSEMTCKLLTAAYMMLLASPVTDQVPELTKVPLIALVGACSLGKTATNALLMNHFSDKVYMENGTTKSQSIEAKIKTTSLTLYGDDFRSQDTESKICNAVYDKIGTTTKSGGSLNDPQASVVYSTNVTDPRVPRVRGRSIFLTMQPWMDSLSASELDKKRRLGAVLTNTKEKALPYLLSLVQRSVSDEFITKFSELKNGPFCSELPIKSDQRLLSFYALLFCWMHELAHEFPDFFDREATLLWINGNLTAELKHYYALDDSSKTDFERWIQAFSAVVEQMSDYQRLRVSRITTPSKLCGGLKCLLIYPKKCPVVLGSTIADFKQIVKGMGGETNASQVVLSSSSTDTRLITKGPDKNTEGKRCYMVPVKGLSKACKSVLYSAFGVDDSDTDSASDSGSDSGSDSEASCGNGDEAPLGNLCNIAAKICNSGPAAQAQRTAEASSKTRTRTKTVASQPTASEPTISESWTVEPILTEPAVSKPVVARPKKLVSKPPVVSSTRTLRNKDAPKSTAASKPACKSSAAKKPVAKSTSASTSVGSNSSASEPKASEPTKSNLSASKPAAVATSRILRPRKTRT